MNAAPLGGSGIDRVASAANHARMSDIIYPRSPRETMDGWPHLPRYVDKIRLHLAGRLHPDYQPNFGKGFDGGGETCGRGHQDSKIRTAKMIHISSSTNMPAANTLKRVGTWFEVVWI